VKGNCKRWGLVRCTLGVVSVQVVRWCEVGSVSGGVW